jgi:hypothetical protein
MGGISSPVAFQAACNVKRPFFADLATLVRAAARKRL